MLKNEQDILASIQIDTTMLERWDRYRIEYRYAQEIKFSEVMLKLKETIDWL
jgi:hypothetical protein